MKMKNMQNVSGNPQSILRNRNATTTITHMAHSGMKSLTASKHTMNSAQYTIVRQPP